MSTESGFDGEDFAVLSDEAASTAADEVFGDDDDFLGYETQPGQDQHDPLLGQRVEQAEAELSGAVHVVDERVMGYLSEDGASLGGDEIAHDDGTMSDPDFLDDQEVEDALRHPAADD